MAIRPEALALSGIFNASVASQAVPFVIAVPFSFAGVLADVTVFAANNPQKFKVINAWVITTLGVSGSSCRFRTLAGGLGNAATGAMTCTTAVFFQNTNSGVLAADQTIPAGGSLYLRGTAHTYAGTAYLLCLPQL